MFSISQSGYSLPSPVFLEADLTSKTKSKCPCCFLYFNDANSLNLHSLSIEAGFQCSKCFKTYTSEKGMKQHYGKKHEKLRPSRCRICTKRFRNKYALKFHVLQVHEKVSRQKCELCSKFYYNKYSLNRHISVCKSSSNSTLPIELV